MSPIQTSHSVYRLTGRTSISDIKRFVEDVLKIFPHEVLVKIKGVALNYRDVAIVTSSNYPFNLKDNLVPCSDGAGEIVQVGDAVSEFQVGDTVVGNFDLKHPYGLRRNKKFTQGGSWDGVLREYVALPEYGVTKIPAGSSLTFAEMASLVCAGVTAWNALYGNTPLRPGQTVLFQGTGGVSLCGLILAKAAGAVTIVTSSSDDKLQLVKEKYGVDYVINYKTHLDWAKKVLKVTDGRGVDFIFEIGGAGTIKQSLECITKGGIIAIIGFLSNIPQEDMPNVAQLALLQGCVVRGIAVGSKQMMEDLVEFVTAKKLRLPVDRVFVFTDEGIAKAYELVQRGGQVGKVCISLE